MYIKDNSNGVIMDEKLIKYPHTDIFRIKDTIPVPHPYCITPEHMQLDKMYMNGDTIQEAEKICGAKCGMEGCKLSYDEHKIALLVEVDHDGELQDVPGLQEYLFSINDMTIRDGFAGYAFIKKVH
jgi:hypothetical protein